MEFFSIRLRQPHHAPLPWSTASAGTASRLNAISPHGAAALTRRELLHWDICPGIWQSMSMAARQWHRVVTFRLDWAPSAGADLQRDFSRWDFLQFCLDRHTRRVGSVDVVDFPVHVMFAPDCRTYGRAAWYHGRRSGLPWCDEAAL